MGHLDQLSKAQARNELYDWFSDRTLTNYVLRVRLEFGRPWYELNTLYRIVCFNVHWIVLEFELIDKEIHVYDTLPMHIRDSPLKKHMHGICLMFPNFIG